MKNKAGLDVVVWTSGFLALPPSGTECGGG